MDNIGTWESQLSSLILIPIDYFEELSVNDDFLAIAMKEHVLISSLKDPEHWICTWEFENVIIRDLEFSVSGVKLFALISVSKEDDIYE